MAYGNVNFSTGSIEGGGSGAIVDTSEIRRIAQDALDKATAAESKVNGMDTRITNAENTATAASNKVTELSGTVSGMTNSVSTAVSDAATAKSTADDALSKANVASAAASTFESRMADVETKATKATEDAAKAASAASAVEIVRTVPTSLPHGKMAMIGKNIYVGGPDNTANQLMIVNGGSSDTITLTEGEIAYVNGIVYYGKADGVGILFTGPDDVVSVMANAPTSLMTSTVAAVGRDIYVGDINSTPVKITKVLTPEVRPAVGSAQTLTIWGERIFFYLSNNSWDQVGMAAGLGNGSADDPVLGVPMVGADHLAMNLIWTIVNVTDDWLYLMLKDPVKKTVYGETNVYNGSTLATEASTLESSWTGEEYDTENLGTVTIEGVAGKVFSISKERFQQYAYLTNAANCIAKIDGKVVGWYMATPGSTEGKVWCIDNTGNIQECDPNTELAFRPFIAYKNI